MFEHIKGRLLRGVKKRRIDKNENYAQNNKVPSERWREIKRDKEK